MTLIAKLDADINIDVAQKLIEKIPSGATSAGAAIDAGYARRDGDKLVSHIEFKKGELKVNGKAQGIPGLGGPPAAAEGMPPAGEEADVRRSRIAAPFMSSLKNIPVVTETRARRAAARST